MVLPTRKTNHPDKENSPSLVPPSSFPATLRPDSQQGFSSLRSDYPSWLPRRPPPPAPASTVGTSTPMPTELGEFGELGTDFEQQYRDYLQNASSSSPAADTSGNNDVNIDARRASEDVDADVDYLRREAQAILERGRPSMTSAEDSPSDAIPPAQLGGRKPTSRSIRIVNLGQDSVVKGLGVDTGSRREGTDQTRVASDSGPPIGQTHARAHSQSNWYSKKHAKRVSGASAYSRAQFAPSHLPQPPIRPRLNIRGLRLEMLRSPSRWMKVYYRLWPILVFGHLPLQAFLDFNAVYMILQVSRYPLPTASPNSGKNWALCAAGYIACWLISVLAIFVLYELVYSFARRWRVRRPLIFPLYLSAPGYNYASLTSFNVFCFFQHLRWTAFFPLEADVLGVSASTESSALRQSHHNEKAGKRNGITTEPRTPPAVHHRLHSRGDSNSSIGSLDANEEDPALRSHQRSASYQLPASRPQRGVMGRVQKRLKSKARRVQRKLAVVTWRDGLAETFNLYSQNLPNVLVLIPRAAMALGLVLAFSPSMVAPGSLRVSSTNALNRDPAFFRRSDGLLTQYALGVLWANIAWTAWRCLVLLLSWIGLWVLSGHGCAGICGPRDKWEEEEHSRLSRTFSIAGDGHRIQPANPDPANNRISAYSAYTDTVNPNRSYAWGDDYSDVGSVLPWEWRECTKARVKDAWEYCLVGMKLRWGLDEKRDVFPRDEKPAAAGQQAEDDDDGGLDDEGLQRVLAAVGFPSPTSPSKRPALRQDLFEAPSPTKQPSSSLPPGTHSANGPLLKLPYPFTKPGSGQVSSNDLVPFPAKQGSKSSKKSAKSTSTKSSGSSKNGSSAGSGTSESGSGSGEEDEEDAEGEQDEERGEEEEEEEDSSSHEYSAESSTHSSASHSRNGSGACRASNSMSSLGHPIPASMGINARAMHLYSPSPPPISPISGGSGSGNGSGSRPGSRSSPNQPLAHVQRQGPFGAYNTSSSSPIASPAHGTSGNTRFPFLSGPPVPATYNHRPRHAAGRQSGSSGHSRGLSQVSGMSGMSGISGISMLSTGTGAMSAGSGYAASGSAGPGMSDENADLSMSYGVVVGRERNESERSGSSSGSGNTGSSGSRARNESGESGVSRGSDGLPMPPRHPNLAEGRRRSRTSISTGPGSKHSSPVIAQHPGVAFPTGSGSDGKVTPPNSDDAELGMGVLAHENAMRAIRGRYNYHQAGNNRSRVSRVGEDDGESLQLSLRERHRPVELDEESVHEDEEVQAEREDVVGLLGTGSGRPSPRASIIGSEGSRPRSRRGSYASRDSSVARRPLSLSLVGSERSRNNSLVARQRRESVASAARERVSSFGVRMRERAQSLMQSVVGGRNTVILPTTVTREASMARVPTTPGHRRLVSITTSDESAFAPEVARVTGTASATTPEIVRISTTPAVSTPIAAATMERSVSGQSENSSESSGSAPHPQQVVDEEAYASSVSGSHSRSGSESFVGDMNYTFGRPVPFLPPRAEHVPLARDSDFDETDEDDSRAHGRPPLSASDSSEDGHGHPVHDPQNDEDMSERYFSPARTRTGSATPSMLSEGLVTPVPGPQQPSFAAQQALSTPYSTPSDDSPRQAFLSPSDALTRRNTESVSMLSSAAPSFVTAPSFADSNTTSTSGATIRGSTGESSGSGSVEDRPGGLAGMFLAARPRLLSGQNRRDSGMVERANDVVGAGGHIGDGRVA